MQDRRQICEQHNKPFLMVVETKRMCTICLENRFGHVMSIEEFDVLQQNRMNEIIQQSSQKMTCLIKFLEDCNSQLLIQKETICKQITAFQQTIIEKIKLITNQNQQNISIIQGANEQRIDEVVQICKQRDSKLKQEIKAELINNIQTLQSQCNLNTLIQKLNYLRKEPIIFKTIDYKFQENTHLKNQQDCTAFAFNKQNTILFAGCRSQIVIYSLKDGIIQQELQRLTDHQNIVTSLQFLQKQKQLISTSADYKIIIWQEDDTQQWKSKQQLAAHNEWIISSTINRKQNLLITGGYDLKIKFWGKKLLDKWQISQELDEQYKATQLSLNPTDSILVATGEDRIIIIEKSQDQQWKTVQKIEVKEKGVRVCFVSNNEFIFQPNTQGVLEIYRSNSGGKEFQKVNQLQVNSCKECQNYFPAQYLGLLGIVVIKHENHINFIKKDLKNMKLFYLLHIRIQFYSVGLVKTGNIQQHGMNHLVKYK